MYKKKICSMNLQLDGVLMQLKSLKDFAQVSETELFALTLDF